MKDFCKANGGINLWKWNIRRAQIIVTYYCNQKCSFCINYQLGKKRKGIVKISDVVYFLNYVKYVQKLDEAIIVLLGGEPTLAPIETLKEICTVAHELGYKTETYTNGTSHERLLELDGYIDYLTISNYSDQILPAENMDYLYDFKHTTITISKLITKQEFKSFEELDCFVDKANEIPFNYDFSTLQKTTPDIELFQPEWIDSDFVPRCQMQDVGGKVPAGIYKDRLVKFSHMPLDKVEDICTLKLFPNGNSSSIWKDDQVDIEYKSKIKQILERGK